MPDFAMQPNFPIASVIDAAQRNNALQQHARENNQRLLLDSLQTLGQVGQSLVDRRRAQAQALAIGRQLNVPEADAGQMTPEQALSVGKELQPISVPYMDKEGQIKILSLPKGSKGVPSAGTPPKPQQSQYVDPVDGTPLNFMNGQYLRPDGNPPGGIPVLKKGDESAVSDANLIVQQVGNVDKLFDAYKNKSKMNAALQATPLGNFSDPALKQIEDSLKLSAFTFGGKNLTGQEKEVVFGALFPKPTDALDPETYENKRNLLKNFYAGKIDLLQAANLLGPAGSQLKSMLQKKMNQGTPKTEPESKDVLKVGGTFNGQKIVGVKLKKK